MKSRHVMAIALGGSSILLFIAAGARSNQRPSDGFLVHSLNPSSSDLTKPAAIVFPRARTNGLYSVTVPCPPEAFAQNSSLQIDVKVSDSAGAIGSKTLHTGDPDLYLLLRPRADGPLRIDLRPRSADPGLQKFRIVPAVVQWPGDADRIRNLAYKPNGDWKSANPMELGRTVFGTGDLSPYVPAKIEESTRYYDATRGEHGLIAARRTDSASDWLTFEYGEDSPRLVYFQLDLPERDNIPPDVSIFTEQNGQIVPYETGADPVTAPHEVQSLPGNKFTTRIISRGKYFVRVIANHPEWRLRTQLLEPPPYSDPNRAVEAGIDYLLGAGDSWHANIPRSGSRLDRISNVHAETAQCIACHPTQFTTRAVFAAMKFGYRPQRIESLRFLTERLANNPRPFYGHPGATWVRMISAPGNVTSRVADLVSERNAAFREPLDLATHLGAYNYLRLYYQGRKDLPEDESNGNTPLVSQYEVVLYAWRVFEREYRRTGRSESRQLADLAAKLLEHDRHRNLIDISWHTVAMAEIDKVRFAEKIRANCERILALQREDGQWSMQFDAKSPSVEFQTGHALYALAAAGYGAAHPAVNKTVTFLLARQQPFGGWFDPNQTYENFRTPFRETQFAVMALSRLYPARAQPVEPKRHLGQERGSDLLDALDEIQTEPSPEVTQILLTQLTHPEPLLRQAAACALSHSSDPKVVPRLISALGDQTKMVQRAAAVALRSLAAKGLARNEIANTLQSTSARVRWGALRVFAYHARTFAKEAAIPDRLAALVRDPSIPVRVAALQGLWQQFWWSDDSATKEKILDSILARLGTREHPWVLRNAKEALYNVADENTRYLYNNWIPALASASDRDKASASQRAQDSMIARKLAAVLQSGRSEYRLNILQAISEFHLRNVRAQNTRYARIGNDVEQIRFSGAASRILDPVFAACLKDRSPLVRRYAAIAAFTLRDNGPLSIASALLGALTDPDAAVRAAAAEFYRSIPVEPASKHTEAAVAGLLQSMDESALRAGIEIALVSEQLERSTVISNLLDTVLNTDVGISGALELMKKNSALRKSLRGASVISDAVSSVSAAHRSGALGILQTDEALRKLPAIQAALNEVVRAGGESAESAGRLLVKTDSQSDAVAAQPDVRFFSSKVMPLFAKKSASDGLACVSCHFNHNILRVTAPDAQGRFTDAQVRETYRAALKVVSLRNPELSLLLRKPTSSSASEGLVDAKTVAHGGGVRWSGVDDPDYQTVLAWIRGAREDSDSASK